MCKVIKDYGIVAEKGNKNLNLQTISNIKKEKRLALVSYRDGMSVNITDITNEAKKLKELLEGYLDYKTPEKVKEEVKWNKDIVRSLTTLAALDGNYKGTLIKASIEDIEEAIKQMQKGGSHATRIKVCQAELKRRNGANSKPQKGSEKKEEKKAKILTFPTEDKRPKVIVLVTEGTATYEECEAKLNTEAETFKDADSQYVIQGLLELCKVDQDFRNNVMRKDKSYGGFMEYMFNAAKSGYCVKYGNVGWIDRDMGLGLAIDYYNADCDKMKKEEKKAKEDKANGKNKSQKKGRASA